VPSGQSNKVAVFFIGKRYPFFDNLIETTIGKKAVFIGVRDF
jgi:hypothetical protein